MADETMAVSTSATTKTDNGTAHVADASPGPTSGEVKPVESGDVAAAESAEAPESVPQAENSNDNTTSEHANGDDTKADNSTGEDTTAANGTPPSAKKGTPANRRKSAGNIADSKKKTPAKKKAPLTLNLNAQPGDFFFVAMRGYQPWPVIVCDEEMLPEALLSKRPVSAKRIDGTYREDFLEGGKNAKDRRYPVMFLGSNEFAWQVNTDLQPFDIETVKHDVETGNNHKKSKGLWEAYQIAAEGHDLDWFKDVLNNHEQAMQVDAEAQETAAAAKKETKKGKRKSQAAAVDSEEETPEGAASAKKSKPTKKRKKDTESDGEPEKPAKTPKTTKLKLNAPKDASAAKPKKETKAKKAKAKSESVEAEAEKPQETPLTEAELFEKHYKPVLYLRHKLQKGFISREDPPSPAEMPQMSTYIKQLENLESISAAVIKKTKVHKVLRGIVKLESVPREDEFEFKKRSTDLLTRWAKILSADTENAEPAAATTQAAPATNGVNHDAKPGESKEDATKLDEAVAAAPAANAQDGDGDTTMAEAKDEASNVQTEDANAGVGTKATDEAIAA